MPSFASRRARSVPESVFLLMDQAKARRRKSGGDLIDLSIGSSDLPPPREVMEALAEAALDPTTYGYCLRSCTRPFLEAATDWFFRRFGVRFDPDREALTLIGTQEGLGHLLLAVLDPGDVLLLPEVAYPSYWGAAAVAGAEPYPLPLDADYRPVLEAPPEVLRRAKALLLNFPNNPTAAVADRAYFERALAFAEEHDLLVIHDNPYVDFLFEGEALPLLAVEGARARAVELFSFSKSYHLGGVRLGFALGNAEAIAALERVKAPIDFNQYAGILRMGIRALELPLERIRRDVQVFKKRRDALLAALRRHGIVLPAPKASLYLWMPLPKGMDDVRFALRLAEEAGVALAPGQGFGPGGRGYVRFALVQPPEVLEEAARRIAAFLD